MEPQFPSLRSSGPSTPDRRSFVRLLLGASLVGPAFVVAGCESLKGQPVRNPYIHGGRGDRGNNRS